MRFPTLVAIAAAMAAAPGAIVAQRPDSTVRLPDRRVSVARGNDSMHRLGAAATVVDHGAVQRGRLSTGLDEALAFVPGVYIGNRSNYSLDQRLSIRGFGARANFGLRGVKVLLDGVPQTLPDGQSQLTNVDLALVDRAEVLRGAASSLHGNAAGGVIAFRTRVVPRAPTEVTARTESGSWGSSRTQIVAAARNDRTGGTIAASRFVTRGSREHAAAEQRRLSAGMEWAATARTTLSVRLAAADDPRAENPGALTASELVLNRRSAAPANVLRGADKAVRQQQVAVGARYEGDRVAWEIVAFGLRRDLDNPIAAPPPGPPVPSAGTWVGIDRLVGGVRTSASARIGTTAHAPRITAGADIQAMRDDRENRAAIGGVPGQTLLLQQRESVREFGPFAQVTIPVSDAFGVRSGVRHDRVRFAVRDQLTADGDASGARTMAATSGHTALTFTPSRRITAWTSVATAFETPTTTELANREEGDGGFNTVLDPQRSVSVEMGLRAAVGGALLEAAAYRTTTRDALIAYRENAGRTYFRNAGRTRTHGAEAGADIPMRRGLAFRATWTYTLAVFTDYTVPDGAQTVPLDGNQLAGIPRHIARLGVRGPIGHGFAIDIDHAFSSMMYADDHNTIAVDGWGAGVTGARASWHNAKASYDLSAFMAVLNVFDRDHVGAVTINGGGGRVFEPGAGRTVYVGMTFMAGSR